MPSMKRTFAWLAALAASSSLMLLAPSDAFAQKDGAKPDKSAKSEEKTLSVRVGESQTIFAGDAA